MKTYHPTAPPLWKLIIPLLPRHENLPSHSSPVMKSDPCSSTEWISDYILNRHVCRKQKYKQTLSILEITTLTWVFQLHHRSRVILTLEPLRMTPHLISPHSVTFRSNNLRSSWLLNKFSCQYLKKCKQNRALLFNHKPAQKLDPS